METSPTNPSSSAPASTTEADSIVPVFKYYGAIAEMGVIRFFIDHKIFDAIPEQGGKGISVVNLAEQTHVELPLLERFTNFLVSCGILASGPDPGHVVLTDLSVVYREGNRGALAFLHAFDFFLVPVARWPEYFQHSGPREPKQANYIPISYAHDCPDKSFHELLETMPARAALFNKTMQVAVGQMPISGMYDFQWLADAASSTENIDDGTQNRKLIVDVGGGRGQALKVILDEYEAISPSRCVLFDRPHVIQEAERENDEKLRLVNKVAGSFFEEQPVKGALVYHIRRVLNDWPDDDALKILSQTAAACASDSRILVSEQLLPSPPKQFSSVIDIFLLSLGGKRRSENMYRELASRAGLKVTGVFPDTKSDTAVVEMMLV